MMEYFVLGGFIACAIALLTAYIHTDLEFRRWSDEGRISPRDVARYNDMGGVWGGFTFCDPIGPPGTYHRLDEPEP